jgi:mono/diheme cytochrome c family protein
MMKYSLLIAMIVVLTQVGHAQQNIVTAQSNSAIPTEAKSISENPARNYDFAQLTRGRKLYLEHCAECHGKNAEGAPNWRKKNPDGKYPPPPLNGTGHAWHHPMKALRMTIRDGTQKIGGNMPAWGGKLSAQEMDDIITWFQSEWPDEIWQAWSRHNKKFTNR